MASVSTEIDLERKTQEIGANIQRDMNELLEHFKKQHEEMKAAHGAMIQERNSCREECERMRNDARKQIAAEKEALDAEKTMFQSEKDAMESVHKFQMSRILLDVGGHKFTTSLQSLTSVPDTFLSSMFSGRFPLEVDDGGCYFINRDGEHFRFILNYLRDPTTFSIQGMLRFQQAQLAHEAMYYGLKERMFPYWDAEEIAIRRLRSAISLTSPSRAVLLDTLSQAKAVVIKLSSQAVKDEYLGVYALTNFTVNGALVWTQQPESGTPLFMWTTPDRTIWISTKNICEKGEGRGYLQCQGSGSRSPMDSGTKWKSNMSATKTHIWQAKPADDDTWMSNKVSMEVLSAIAEDVPELSLLRGLLERTPK